MNIYTIGAEGATPGDIRTIAANLKLDIMDVRTERPAVICDRIIAHVRSGGPDLLLLGNSPCPTACRRHEKIAVPLLVQHNIDVAHIWFDTSRKPNHFSQPRGVPWIVRASVTYRADQVAERTGVPQIYTPAEGYLDRTGRLHPFHGTPCDCWDAQGRRVEDPVVPETPRDLTWRITGPGVVGPGRLLN